MNKIEMLNAQLAAMESINMYFMEDRGTLITLRQLMLTYDRYDQTDDHTWARLVRHAGDIIRPDEIIWRDIMKNINFSDHTIMIMNITGPKTYQKHYHIEHETIYVGRGTLTENINNITIEAGDRIKINPMQPHIIEAHGPCSLLVTIHPPALNNMPKIKNKAS